ncbi:MAG: hypothetical protein LBJ72_02850 [Dysgonamonadaceae bacterium]|jgi:hypothetical protein|nr:hypothetical protein [Dysgonamonadaceae bacterium]
MGSIIEFLLEKWPVALWIILTIIVASAYFKLKGKVERAHDKVDNLPCDKHSNHIENQKDNHRNLDLKIEKMSNNMDYMNKSITDVSRVVDSISNKLGGGIISASPLTQIMSPLTLTERGKSKAEELGLKEMIDNNWESINNLIGEKSKSKNPYDIQQICIDEATLFPEIFLSQDGIDRIKTDAYKNGDLLQSYMRVVAVIVRDRFFDEHGIDVSEVDVHDPNNTAV